MRKKIKFENGILEKQIIQDAGFKKLILVSANINKIEDVNVLPFVELILSNDDSMFKSYSNLSSDIEIKFILKIDDIAQVNNLLLNKDEYGMNSLYKYLHLYKTIKQSNMNLYTTNYKIKTFKNEED